MADAKTDVVLKRVRLSYVHVKEPHAIEEGQAKKYSVSILIPNSDKKNLQLVNSAIKAATEKGIKEKWGGKKPRALKQPLRDGDEEREGMPEYEDCTFFNAYSTNRIPVVDKKVLPLEDLDELYSGCYANVNVNFYAYEGASKGVAAGLQAIQKVAEGERLSGSSVDVQSVFDAEDDDDDDDDDLLG